MPDTITITGLVATAPRHMVTSEGLPITSFRLASAQRRFDRSQERWIDAETNWYTITSFRQLAINAAGSVGKGDRMVVTGRLRIREWENGERTGTNIDIEADAMGHDLMWGTSKFNRTMSASTAPKASEAGSGEQDSEPTAAEPGQQATAEPSQEEAAAASPEQAVLGAEPVAALPY